MLPDHPDKPGAFVQPHADNMPPWSLSYEWWFYMMFYPINRWVPVRRQKFVVLGPCVAVMIANQFAPCSVFNCLVFFVIWWTGVEFAREFLDTGNVTVKRQGIMLALLAVPAAWYGLLLVEAVGAGRKILFIKFPFVDFRNFLMSGVFIVLEEIDGRCRRLTGLTLIFGLEATNMPCRMALGKGVLCGGASVGSGAVIGRVPILVLPDFTKSEAFGQYWGGRLERMGPTNQWMLGSFTRDICRETFIFGFTWFYPRRGKTKSGGRAQPDLTSLGYANGLCRPAEGMIVIWYLARQGSRADGAGDGPAPQPGSCTSVRHRAGKPTGVDHGAAFSGRYGRKSSYITAT